MRLILPILTLLLALCTGSLGAAGMALVPAGQAHSSPDKLLAATIEDIRASKPDSALASVNRLIAMRPDFKLAYLIKGDLLLAKNRELPGFGGTRATSSQAINDFKDEARVRLQGYLDQPNPDTLPAQILQLAQGQRYALLVDAGRSRIYIFENLDGEPRLIHDYYLSIGKNGLGKHSEGDKRSPSGVYTIKAALPRQQLTPFYGAGAFTISYPNEWDSMQGNSGHGIWLHGVPPNTYSRPPKASDGCLVVANPDWQAIAHYIQPDGTPIIITDHIEWLDREAWQAKRHELSATLDSWKDDWQKLDVNGFLDHYAPDYLNSLGKAWVTAKQRNITQKDWIKVGLSDMSLFLYNNGNDNLAAITVTQHYSSDKLNDVTRKKIYFRQQAGQWRIVLEKNLQSTPVLALRKD